MAKCETYFIAILYFIIKAIKNQVHIFERIYIFLGKVLFLDLIFVIKIKLLLINKMCTQANVPPNQ